MTPGNTSRVRVALPEGGYDVLVGRGLLGRLGEYCREAGMDARRVHVFEDAGVPSGLRDSAVGSFSSAVVSRTELRLDEASKSIATLEPMLVALAQAHLERSDLVVALGGGIVGDVAGLAAGLHRRGVRVVQCPTTLLAMADASVGGKTGVNLRASVYGSPVLLKNAVGVFHQPSLVVADVDALASLPPREFRSGLAECIKHAVISGGGGSGLLSLAGLSEALPGVLARKPDLLEALVATHVGLKAGVVAGDERETATGTAPGRRALNLGHTFAHAIEGCDSTRVAIDGQHLHPIHGEAVGLGLIAAARLAELVGLGSADRCLAIGSAVKAAGLPTQLAAAPDVSELIDAMREDKKASGGRLRVVLPTSDGVSMLDDPGNAALACAWGSVL